MTTGPRYTPKLDHRNRSPQKSQWTISSDEEQQCFNHAYGQNWQAEGFVWGLYFVNGNQPAYLGETAFHHRNPKDLFLAKFIDSYGHNDWHGYPADHYHNAPRDIPPTAILRIWLTERVLHKSIISKLTRGKACSL